MAFIHDSMIHLRLVAIWTGLFLFTGLLTLGGYLYYKFIDKKDEYNFIFVIGWICSLTLLAFLAISFCIWFVGILIGVEW